MKQGMVISSFCESYTYEAVAFQAKKILLSVKIKCIMFVFVRVCYTVFLQGSML